MCIVLTAIFFSFVFLKPYIPSHRLLFTFFFLYTIMLPGYLAALRFSPWAKGVLRVLTSFVFGTMIAYSILFIAALFHLDVRLFGLIIPVIVLALGVWLGLRPADRDDTGVASRMESGPLSRAPAAILIALIVAVSLMVISRGDPLIYTGDSPDHIAYIRTISRTHEAFPDQFYYHDGGTLTHDIRKGMGQVLWGAVNAMTGNDDVAAVWPIMSLISSIFTIVALFCAGILLFGSASIGLTAAFLFVLFYDGGLRGYHLTMGAAGYLFGRTFFIAALACLPIAIARKRSGYMLVAIVSAIAAAMTHVAHFAALMFIALVFALSNLIGPGEERRSVRFRRWLLFGAATLCLLVPYFVFRYVRDYAPNNALHSHVQGVLYLTDKLYVLNPLVFIQAAGPLGILAAISIIFLWKKSRSDGNLRLLLNGMLAVYVLLFNPLWYPYLLEKMSYLLFRFEFAVPSMLPCACLLHELWSKMRGRNPELSPFGAVVAFTAAAVLLGPPLLKTPAEFAYGGRMQGRDVEASYRSLNDLFHCIQEKCPPGAVIASDPITSFGIPAFTDAYVICPYDQHATPNDSTAVTRIVDCRRMFSPGIPLGDIRDVLVEYGAEYLVINGRIPPGVGTMYWKPDAKSARALSERLRGPESPFEIIFESLGVTMAKLRANEPSTSSARSPAPLPFLGDSIDARTAASLTSSGISDIRIAAVQPGRAEAARGDTLSMNVTWVALDRCALSSYIASVRFDTGFPKNALYRESLGKPYRKLLELFTRHRYRFRIDFQPLGGMSPPDTWPPMREVRDRVSVAIPQDIAPGTYTISLKLGKITQFPNYSLKDIMTDDDVYGGSIVSTIRVSRGSSNSR
ncbi:MAG: hypothetical protein PHD74_04580 [Candidatus Krumholzibacteria bacterium]|nr:hypothetical protein [Candidatus Krumholzibacteria bacterium]